MSDRAGFLAAIRAEPDEDAHRLVYADWLEDHGESARAELIRVQCELAAGAASRQRQRALLARERLLRREHEVDWLAPLQGPLKPERVEWERGLATVRLTNRHFLDPHFEEQAVQAFRRAGVGELDVGWVEGLPSGPLARSAVLREVALLQVDQDPFEQALAESVAASPHLAGLRKLALGYQSIESGALQALAASPHLQGLTHLDAGGLWGDFDQAGLEALTAPGTSPRLTSLVLHGRAFGDRQLPLLLGAAWFGRLTALDLESWDLGDAGARAFAAAAPKGLRRLGLGSTRLQRAGARALAEADLPELEALDVSANPLGAPAAIALLRSPRLPRLRELNLRVTRLADPGARKLARSAGLARLTSLRLEGAGLAEDGLSALADSPHLENLTHLSVGNQGSGDAEVRQLAQSPYLAGLVRLELWWTSLTVQGARALARSPYLDDLAVLDLRACKMTAAAARELARGRALGGVQQLRLSGLNEGDVPPKALEWLGGRFGDAVSGSPR